MLNCVLAASGPNLLVIPKEHQGTAADAMRSGRTSRLETLSVLTVNVDTGKVVKSRYGRITA